MSALYIGLMSGTSADGIDAVLVDFSETTPRLIETHYHEFPPSLRRDIIALYEPGENELHRLAELDRTLGKTFALCAQSLLKKKKLDETSIRAIGCHGQTIRHLPDRSFTLQIGDPNIIAAETGITTIADFRRRDIAFGGQGAPLVPAFHHALFFDKNTPRAIINIGGIANVTLLNTDQTILGFDTGPGNTLLDAWAERHLQKNYDEKGAWAAQGKIDTVLLEKLLQDPYISLPPPKSTGRDYFNLTWLKHHLSNTYAPVDVQRTLTEFTAQSITQALPQNTRHLFICGGGTHNTFLMSCLKDALPDAVIQTTETLGVPPDWVEAMAFAWLAKQTLENKHGNIPAVTGASKSTVLGGVYFA